MSQSSKPPVPKKVTPIKIQKIGPGNYSTTRASASGSTASNLEPETFADAVNPLDLFRVETRLYHLVHREDTKNCPLQVARCEQCRFNLTNADIVLVRRNGVKESTCPKTGKIKQGRQSGNIYLHYLKKCLEGHDDKFSFSAIVALKETLKHLPTGSAKKRTNQRLQLEPKTLNILISSKQIETFK